MSAAETGQMSSAETGQMSAAETRQMQDIETGVVQEAEVCSLSIKSRFLEFIRRRPGETGADRRRPGETGGVPGYGVKHPQADPPHPRAKARMTAVKQTPSNYLARLQHEIVWHINLWTLGLGTLFLAGRGGSMMADTHVHGVTVPSIGRIAWQTAEMWAGMGCGNS